MWPFKVIKQLFLPFSNNCLTISLFPIIFFPSALTLLLILSGIFFFVDVIASVVNLLYLSVLIWYIFDVLLAKTKGFFDLFKAWRQYPCLILIYDVLSYSSSYYIQFKEVKVLWRPGAGCEVQGLGTRARGGGTDNPNTLSNTNLVLPPQPPCLFRELIYAMHGHTRYRVSWNSHKHYLCSSSILKYMCTYFRTCCSSNSFTKYMFLKTAKIHMKICVLESPFPCSVIEKETMNFE